MSGLVTRGGRLYRRLKDCPVPLPLRFESAELRFHAAPVLLTSPVDPDAAEKASEAKENDLNAAKSCN